MLTLIFFQGGRLPTLLPHASAPVVDREDKTRSPAVAKGG